MEFAIRRSEIAAEVHEEGLKWETDLSERRSLQEKIQTLRTAVPKTDLGSQLTVLVDKRIMHLENRSDFAS